MKNRKKKGQFGFTLIELLAVVAILGILAGVAVPRVMGVLANARVQANVANIAILQSAVECWAIDNPEARTVLLAWGCIVHGDPEVGPYLLIRGVAMRRYLVSIPKPPTGSGRYRIVLTNTGTATTPVFVATVVVKPRR